MQLKDSNTGIHEPEQAESKSTSNLVSVRNDSEISLLNVDDFDSL